MKSAKHVSALNAGADPFGERAPTQSLRIRALGCSFTFASNDERLLRLAKQACGGLPPQRFPKESIPPFAIELRLCGSQGKRRAPAPLRLHSGGGVLCGMFDADNFALVLPQQGRALISVSASMLAHPYHVRYELLEFAVYLLAARTRGLVPLHAACVGRNGRGVLLMGASGAGKSTLSLHCLLQGMEFLAEDSVLVRPRDLRATGLSHFLHLRVGGEYFLERPLRWMHRPPTIRRRSGIKKLEIDMRAAPVKLAQAPLRIQSLIFLSAQRPRGNNAGPRLLSTAEAIERLRQAQPYAVTQPGWTLYQKKIAGLRCYELYRQANAPEQARMIAQLLT